MRDITKMSPYKLNEIEYPQLGAGIEYQRYKQSDVLKRDAESLKNVKDMLADIGLINLSMGKLKVGIDRLVMAKKKKRQLYAGLAYLKMGDKQGAIRELVKTVERCT